jgi:S1-C subfamily serine protease
MRKTIVAIGSAIVLVVGAIAFSIYGEEAGDIVSEKVSSLTSVSTLEPMDVEFVSARIDARSAAVRVVTPSGRGSGTYAKIGGHYVVITAQHVVKDEPIVIVEGRNGEYVYGEPILHGITTDVAIILVPEINSRIAIDYKPMKKPRNIDRLIGKEVTYSGFPGSHDILSVDGKIMSYERDHIIIHSYAWPGSSGSGVFDMRGRLIGVVSAVDVGVWNYFAPPQLVEDVVWVAPVWDITEDDIDDHLRSRGE